MTWLHYSAAARYRQPGVIRTARIIVHAPARVRDYPVVWLTFVLGYKVSMQPIQVTEAQILRAAVQLYRDNQRIEATEFADKLPSVFPYFGYVTHSTRRSHVTRALRRAGYHHSNVGSKHYWSRIELEPVVKPVKGVRSREPGLSVPERVLPLLLEAFPVGTIFTNLLASRYLQENSRFGHLTCKVYAGIALRSDIVFEVSGQKYRVKRLTRNAGAYKAGKKEFVRVN